MLITETWLKGNISDNSVINELVPSGYCFIHKPRCDRRGGGIAIVYKAYINIHCRPTITWTAFEHCEIYVSNGSWKTILSCIYRPPPSNNNKIKTSTFIYEFEQYIGQLAILPSQLLVLGDFNIHVDVMHDTIAKQLSDCLSKYNLTQLCNVSTHINGHTLDLVISRLNNELNLKSLIVTDLLISDHYPVVMTYDIKKETKSATKRIRYRNVREIDNANFSRDISNMSVDISKCSNMTEIITTYIIMDY